jgi:AcrR family transcriptional regulator
MDVASPPGSGAHERKSGHRRRGPSLEVALLDAAWDELHVVGYAALTMDGVAARAGTSKAVLYRRWQNRAELILAVLHQRRPMISGEVPDTGSLRGDVIALLRRASAGIAEIGTETIFGLFDELSRQPEAAAYLFASRVSDETMAAILLSADRRGEVRLESITRRVASLPLHLLRYELLWTRAIVPDDVIEQIVDEVFLPLVLAR